MKMSRTLLTAVCALTLLSAPLFAGQRPVLEAARQAGPVARWRAAQHVRQAYPEMAGDLYAQLKARYPDLEHGLVDAALDTWEQHPALLEDVEREVKARHGQELAAARRDVMAALEAAYPDFPARLRKVLDEKGPRATWKRFLGQYDRGQPGLGELASRPRERNPERARQLVALLRNRAPGLAEDFTRRWLDGRKELAAALQAEFPGAGKVVAETLQAKSPQLVSQVLATVQSVAGPARSDFRTNADKRLPGIAEAVETLLVQRYPNLRQELLAILKG